MTPERAALVLAGARRDPVAWVDAVTGFKPWAKQVEILESVRDNRVTAVRSCHAIGKSTIAALIVWWFFLNHPRSIVLTTATSNRQVKGILWKEVHAIARRAAARGTPFGGHLTQTRVSIDEDWWAWGFTSKDYDATQFQGYHAPYVLVVVDEAAGVTHQVFEGLDSAMSSGHARMLMIGNPTDASGDFAKAFIRTDYARFAVSAFDSPNFTHYGVTLEDIRTGKLLESGVWKDKVTGPLPYPQLISPTWVRDKWIEWCGGRKEGEVDPRWQARVMGRFPEGGDDMLIPLSWVEAAHDRWNDLNEAADAAHVWPKAQYRVGVDVARLGDDSTERAFFLPGAGVREMRTSPKQDTMQTTGEIMSDARELDVGEVRVDADGLGAGVYDRLVEIGPSFALVEIRGGMRANDHERFANRRAEMYWQLREALDPGGDAPIALPPDTELTRQLVSIKWKLRSNGAILIESKDEIRARIGRSPDKADAVAYANARFQDDGAIAIIDPSVGRSSNPYSGV